MIIVKLAGGLGNQMFQYATALCFAKKNNVAVKVDCTSHPTVSYRLDVFEKNTNKASIEDIALSGGKRSTLEKAIDYFGFFNRNTGYFREKERTVFDPLVFSKDNRYLDGYWQNEKYFNEIRKDVLNAFTFKNAKKVENIANEMRQKNSVAIHVRRGDYLKHSDIGVLDLDYYKLAIDTLVQELMDSNEPLTYYIFSNDQSWCESNFNFLPECQFVTGYTDDIDLYLMSQCKHNIIANSTFSWWSAWLNTNDSKVVISPLRWVATNPRNHNWVPDSWRKI